MELDTKTYWLTDRQSQCDLDLDLDLDSLRIAAAEDSWDPATAKDSWEVAPAEGSSCDTASDSNRVPDSEQVWMNEFNK
jgi:hypothetical protein